MSTVVPSVSDERESESIVAGVAEGEEEEEEVVGTDTESNEMSENESGLKKKKKKKKKKKRPSEVDVVADRRFQESIQLLVADSGDDLWVKVDKINLDSNRLSQLCAALRKNTSVLSLDLSDVEGMSGDAVETLCCTLKDGAAPDLIELKVPPLDSDAKSHLSELSKARKNIRVQQQCTATKSTNNQSQPVTKVPLNGKASSRNGDFQNSSIVRKYFQVGNEDEEDESPSSGVTAPGSELFSAEDTSSYMEPEQHAALLWDRMLEVLDDADNGIQSDKVISTLAEPLWTLLEQIELEMNSCALPMVPDTAVDELKPYTCATAKHLNKLSPALHIEPTNSLVTQYSKEEAVQRVGSHRVGIAMLIAQLLRAQCPSIAKAVKDSSLLAPLTQLAFERPTCSALHSAVISSLRVAVSESCGSEYLWRDVVDSPERLIATALEMFRASVESAETRGQRGPGVAFSIAILEVLASAVSEVESSTSSTNQRTKEMEWHRELASALNLVSDWEVTASLNQSSGSKSSLAVELAVQRSELAGPRPVRQPSLDLDPDNALFRGGGQMISGQELLSLLRGLSLKGGHGSF